MTTYVAYKSHTSYIKVRADLKLKGRKNIDYKNVKNKKVGTDIVVSDKSDLKIKTLLNIKRDISS